MTVIQWGTALEADHGLVDGEVAARDVVLLEQLLALVVEGRSLLDDSLSLAARDRWFNVEVAVELHEAVPRHELSGIGVALAGFPVMVQFRKDDDALSDTDS